MSDQPAGLYKKFSYQNLTQKEVDVIEEFSAFPDQFQLSRLIDKGRQTGSIGNVAFALDDNVSSGETATIGNDVYEFLDASDSVSDDAHIAVEIGADKNETATNFLRPSTPQIRQMSTPQFSRLMTQHQPWQMARAMLLPII